MRYAIGDVHGCFIELRILLEEILVINKSDSIYFVGDLVTKGPDSLKVIEYFINLKNGGYNISSVLGNHEWRLLNLYYNDFNMFEEYLKSYNSFDLIWGDLNEIMNFISSFPYYIDTGDWLISHSEIGPDKTYNQFDSRFLFGPDKFTELFDSNLLLNRNQVFGHRVRKLDDILYDCMVTSNMIGIDGGCVYPEYGYLCSLNLDTILLDYVKSNYSTNG